MAIEQQALLDSHNSFTHPLHLRVYTHSTTTRVSWQERRSETSPLPERKGSQNTPVQNGAVPVTHLHLSFPPATSATGRKTRAANAGAHSLRLLLTDNIFSEAKLQLFPRALP